MKTKKQDIVEGLIVFSTITGILLPVRLFFVSHVSDNWFGSFGVISIISICFIVLTKKGKLGAFGKMFDRQLRKLQQGKKAKLVYGQSIFFLIILGGTIFAIESGNSQYLKFKDQLNKEFSELSDKNILMEKSQDLRIQDWVSGLIGLMFAVFFAFPKVAAVFAVLNDLFNGWLLHFYTVAFVEYVELFAILLFHRFTFNQKNTHTDFKTGYS